MINYIVKTCIFFLIPAVAFAKQKPAGFGLVALNMLEPVGLMNDFVNTACFVLGIGFIFAACIKYFEHRRSPLMVPISTVVFLLIAGGVLMLLPFAYHYTENGIHFSLMR